MSHPATTPSPIPPYTPQAPSVHVRALITWIAIFPLVTLGFFAIAPFADAWNPVLRAFVLSIVVVPIAVYLVVPQLIRIYAKIHAARHEGARPDGLQSERI
jgi:antibiotic biosynthesis monooxygenase (ABM) superfamily enzyme